MLGNASRGGPCSHALVLPLERASSSTMLSLTNQSIDQFSDEDICLIMSEIWDCASQHGAVFQPNHPRWSKLPTFIHFWKRELRLYSALDVSPPLTGNDLLCVISSLKRYCNAPKRTLHGKLIRRIPIVANASNIDILLCLGVRLTFMAHVTTADISTSEYGNHQAPWASESLKGFMISWFPMTDHPILSYPSHQLHDGLKSGLKARKLKKLLNAHLWPTDNIVDHLKFDRVKNVIFIFHHAGYIKEQLRLTKTLAKNAKPEASLRL